MSLEIEFDSGKEAINIAKHDISLSFAALLFESDFKERPDVRQDYDEPRMIAIGPINDRLHVCVYTLRNNVRRIISLRRANRRESHDYYQD